MLLIILTTVHVLTNEAHGRGFACAENPLRLCQWGQEAIELTRVVGAAESVVVLTHPIQDGFPVVIDLVKQG